MRSYAFFFGLAATALAHLQMQDPFPIRSALNPKTPEDAKDYSMTTPLVANGLPYPCKGYLTSDSSLLSSQKTWQAGSSQTFTIAPPGAIHGGGSCQLVLSYDHGKTWNVIFSYIGGCMAEELTQSFTIPKEAPSGEVVFGWTWFNRQGNREMYENCAIVTITNGGSGLNPTDHPAPFVANTQLNSCKTTEGTDIVFPNPGKNVKYSGPYKGTVPAGGAGIVGSNCQDGDGNSAGTKGNTGSSGGSGGDTQASSSTTSKSTAATSTTSVPVATVPSTTSTTNKSTVTQQPTQKLVADPSSSSSSSAASSVATTTKQKTCRRRRSVAKQTSIPEQIRSHREWAARRPRSRALSHADLARRAAMEKRDGQDSATGRVAAMKAEYPVYHDKA